MSRQSFKELRWLQVFFKVSLDFSKHSCSENFEDCRKFQPEDYSKITKVSFEATQFKEIGHRMLFLELIKSHSLPRSL